MPSNAPWGPPDHKLPYDLDDPSSKKELENLLQQGIDDDEAAHTAYWQEWDNVDLRLTTAFQPVGWSTDAIEELRQMNDPTVADSDKSKSKVFISVNRARPNHEATLGDYLSITRKLALSAHNPQDRNRARVMQRVVEYIEKKYKMPTKIYFPLMDNAWSKGLHWVKMNWNPHKAVLQGLFTPEEISCRDVLVDNQARGVFFSTARRLTHRFKVDVKDANRMFRGYKHFVVDGYGTDTDYDNAWASNKDARKQDEQATFYYIEFRRTEGRYYIAKSKDDVQEISEAQYDAARKDETLEPYTFMEEEENYYTALYHKKMGVFDLKYNPFGQWLLIPLVNVETPNRLYPMGDVQIYANLCDLLDVLVTVFVKNAKRANNPVYDVDPSVWEDENMQELINSVTRQGGAAPGIKNVHNVQPINNYLTQLIPWTMGWIQDTVSKHSATMGELPAKQIAKETVQALMAKDRTAQGRKDVCLNYTLTTLAELLVKMVAKFYQDPDYIKVTDQKPGREGYIPINQVWTEQEYLASIAQIYRLTPPQQPDQSRIAPANMQQAQEQYENESLAFERAMMLARRHFEDTNQVDEQEVDGYSVPSVNGGQPMMPIELQGEIEKSGMEPQQYWDALKPEKTPMTVYIVNRIDEDLDLDIFYGISSDFADNPEYKANMAFRLREMGMLSMEDFYKMIEEVNGDEYAENAREENQMIQMAKQIASDPQISQQVQAILSGQAKAVPINGEKKSS